MQFVILANFNDTYDRMSRSEQRTAIESEWAKSREYQSKALLRQIWLFEDDQAIMSVFEADSREHMEALLADYPGLKQGFVTAEIRTAVPYQGFAPELAT